MEIRINRKSEIPLRHQLVEQIVFSIATKQLEPGDHLIQAFSQVADRSAT
jgi:DNA-binding transcriptional regulator YhcF (GntR family)